MRPIQSKHIVMQKSLLIDIWRWKRTNVFGFDSENWHECLTRKHVSTVHFLLFPILIIEHHRIIRVSISIKSLLLWNVYVRVIQKFKIWFVIIFFNVVFRFVVLVIRTYSIDSFIFTWNSAMFRSATHLFNSALLSHFRKRRIVRIGHCAICSSGDTIEKNGRWTRFRLLDFTRRPTICTKNHRCKNNDETNFVRVFFSRSFSCINR